MPRFVVLLHETPSGYPRPTHYDLMLEQGDVLWTWALREIPATTATQDAERLPDHRLSYLDFEGQIAGDRGSVRRIDGGTFDLLQHAADHIEIRLQGSLLRGRLTLSLQQGTHRWCVSLSAD